MARTYSFEVESSITIKQLKQIFLDKTNDKSDLQAICFMLNEEILNNDTNTISSYGVVDKSILQLVDLNTTDRGGFSLMGVKFVDLSNNTGLKRVDWSNRASPWRISKPGLCLEGICSNNQCEAHGQRVIMPIGYTVFDIVTDSNETTTKCPVCNKYVEPVTCGFNNCWWRYQGIKQDEIGKPPRKCSSDWQQADNAYHYFDEYTSGIVSWRQLIVEAVENVPSK